MQRGLYLVWVCLSVSYFRLCYNVQQNSQRAMPTDTLGLIFNRWHTCAVSVCVCVSVCLFVSSYSGTTGYEATHEQYHRLKNYENLNDVFPETTVFGRYGMKTSEKPICIISNSSPEPGLARLAHREEMNMLGWCVSSQVKYHLFVFI